MSTNREHFAVSAAEALELIALRKLIEATVLPEGLTGEFEGTFKKIKIENGIITELELE